MAVDQPVIPRSRRWLPLTAAAGAAVVLGASGWFFFLRPTGYEIAGRLALPFSAFSRGPDATTCTGKDGFVDIAAGTEIVVTDAAGATVAVSHLSTGQIEFSTGVPRLCIFSFTAQVPKGAGFYGVTVRDRGTVTFPEADIADGKVDLTLGT